LINAAGDVVAQALSPLTVARPFPTWSEQDPFDWWAATQHAVGQFEPELRRQIQAIGLSGQMHGAVLLSADDRPLRPAILWNDGRSASACLALEARVARSREITGNLAMPGFTAPKLLWVKENEPDVFGQIAHVLLPKDYVRLCLTGDKASDVSDSAGTLWLDTGARIWSEEMLAACELTPEQMPKLYEGNQVTGYLRAELAALWGMGRVPVAAGAGDNAAGAAGIGVIRDGDALLSLGTSGVIFVATDKFRPNPARAVHAFCHCLPNMWHQMSVHLSAASCLDWGAAALGMDVPAFLAAAERAGIAQGPELFLPFLSGERTPHNDPHLRAGFLGLDHDSDAGRLAASVLEGVAFAHADGLAALQAAGTTVETISVIGGGARSTHWGTILASTLNMPLVYLEGGELGPAMGAARLAHMAATGASAAEVCTAPPIKQVVAPDPVIAERLAPKQARFGRATRAIGTI
jgi:xylulokinase